MISAASIGAMKILIGADASGVAKGVKEAENALGKIDGALGGPIGKLTKYAAVAASAGVALVAGLTAASLETIDTQSKLARQLGGTIEGVQALDRTAQLAGLSTEELTKASDKLNRKLGEAMRDGMSPAADALARIGLKASDLANLDVDERMAVIADAIKDVGLNSQQTADLLGQLGIRQGKIFGLIEEGGDAIRAARAELQLFGVTVDKIDGRTVERANDAWTVFGLAAKGIGNQMAVEIAPAIEAVAEQFRQAVTDAGGMENIVAPAVLKVVYAVGVLNREVHLGRVAWDQLAAGALDVLDTVAGAIPRAVEKMTGGLITAADLGFEPLKHEFGKLKDQLGAPPDPQAWVEWFKGLQDKARAASEAARPKGGNDPAETDSLSSKEREGLEKRFAMLQAALANEANALALHRDQQLTQIAEFEAKRIGTTEEWNALRLEAETKYQDALRELQQSRLLNSIATDEELLNQSYEKKLQDLEMFRAQQTGREEYWDEVQRRLKLKHNQNVAQMQASHWSQAASIVDTAMSQISGIIAEEGDKGFTIMKGIAVATALVKGYEAAVSAWATGEKTGIPGMGAVMAGVAIAGTAAYIAKLSGVTSSSQGGAGGGGSVGGGGGATSVPSIAQSDSGQSSSRGGVAEIGITGLGIGDLFTEAQVRKLIEKINEAAGDGVLIKVTG